MGRRAWLHWPFSNHALNILLLLKIVAFLLIYVALLTVVLLLLLSSHTNNLIFMFVWQTVDMAYFLFIMAIFLLAYGVARQAILDPKTSFSWKSVAEIFFVPYFQVFGELFIDKQYLFSGKYACRAFEFMQHITVGS